MKQIELTQGQFALVGDTDYAYIMQWKWHSHWNPHTNSYYAARKEGKWPNQKTVLMHRCIMERVLGHKLERHEQVDHLKGNTLDNRRSELAVKTQQGNTINSGKRLNNTSGFKGVININSRKQYRAGIKVNQKYFYLCVQPNTEEGKIECDKMYDRAYLYLFGDMATARGMNFPELKEQYLNDLKINTYRWMK